MKALAVATQLRHLGARDARQLSHVEVLGQTAAGYERVGRCQADDDGCHRGTVRLDPSHHLGLAVQLVFLDGRTRICGGAGLCPCRCHGLALVVIDASCGRSSWSFGPGDNRPSVASQELEPQWHRERERLLRHDSPSAPALPAVQPPPLVPQTWQPPEPDREQSVRPDDRSGSSRAVQHEKKVTAAPGTRDALRALQAEAALGVIAALTNAKTPGGSERP